MKLPIIILQKGISFNISVVICARKNQHRVESLVQDILARVTIHGIGDYLINNKLNLYNSKIDSKSLDTRHVEKLHMDNGIHIEKFKLYDTYYKGSYSWTHDFEESCQSINSALFDKHSALVEEVYKEDSKPIYIIFKLRK